MRTRPPRRRTVMSDSAVAISRSTGRGPMRLHVRGGGRASCAWRPGYGTGPLGRSGVAGRWGVGDAARRVAPAVCPGPDGWGRYRRGRLGGRRSPAGRVGVCAGGSPPRVGGGGGWDPVCPDVPVRRYDLTRVEALGQLALMAACEAVVLVGAPLRVALLREGVMVLALTTVLCVVSGLRSRIGGCQEVCVGGIHQPRPGR